MAKYLIKNMKQLERYMEKHIEYTLREVADITKQKLIDMVQDRLYDAYEPVDYTRTYEFLNSISRTEVKKVYGRYVVEIYFDSNKIHPYIRQATWNAHADFWGEWTQMNLRQGASVGEWSEDTLIAWIEKGTNNPYYEHDGIWAVRDTLKWIKQEYNRLFREALKYRTNLE